MAVYTHPDKPGFFDYAVEGSTEINVPSDPKHWNTVNEIVAKLAAKESTSGSTS